MPSIEELTETAVAAARRAGAIQKEKYGGLLNVDAALADDIKLEADRLCEKAIVDTIRERYPRHGILAEEGGRSAGSEYIWYVDPLDGTVNFYYGLPYFCTTLACYRPAPAGQAGMGEPVLGVTYAVLTDDLFVGVPGSGATLNGKAARVREEASLADALLVTTIGNNSRKLAFTRDILLELSLKVRKTRNLGAAALDMALVAVGRASAFMESVVNSWDVAAGKALVEAAGGLCTVRPLDGDRVAVVASGRNLHAELLAMLDEGLRREAL